MVEGGEGSGIVVVGGASLSVSVGRTGSDVGASVVGVAASSVVGGAT